MALHFSKKASYKGIYFDSTTERDRYIYLLDCQNKGLISDLTLQPSFEVLPKQTEIIDVQLKTKVKKVEKVVEQDIRYTADFSYYKDGIYIVEDVKGSKYNIERDFPLRKKLMYYFYKIKVKVLFNPTEPI